MNADGMINHDPHARVREIWLRQKPNEWDLEYYVCGKWERLLGSDFGNRLCTYRLTNTETGETIVSPGIEMPVIEEKPETTRKHSHYFKPCPYESIDIYRVLEMWEVTNPAIQHAIKKLMVPGGRGGKDAEKDLQEAIDSIQRAIEMLREDEQP